MTKVLQKQSVTLDDSLEATVTYSLIETECDKRRPYGIRAEMKRGTETLDAVEECSRFATEGEAAAVAELLAEKAITPVAIGDIISDFYHV